MKAMLASSMASWTNVSISTASKDSSARVYQFCRDNIGCNTYSTALVLGEKAVMLIAEDLGCSRDALEMEIPVWHNGTYETTGRARL